MSADLTAREQKFVYLRDLVRAKQKDILAALPEHIKPAYFIRVVMTCLQRNPALLTVDPLSFLGAVLQCAQLGLVPDGFLGQAYLIPYANNRRRPPVDEVQFQVGYRGLITLARRSGEVSVVHAAVVHKADVFNYECGFEPTFHHKPARDPDPGPIIYAYAFYTLKDGGRDLLVMNEREVHQIRSRSQAFNTGIRTGRHDSPWFSDPEWMWKKTSLKQLLKTAPLSVDIAHAASLDDKAEIGLPQDLGMLADDSVTPTPSEPDVPASPEVLPARQEPRRKSEQPKPEEPKPAEAAPLLTDADIKFEMTD